VLSALDLTGNAQAVAAPILKEINGDVGRITRTVASIRKGVVNTASPLANTILPRLEGDLTKLENLLAQGGHSATAAQIAARRTALESARTRLRDSMSGPALEAARKDANLRAERDYSVAERVLNSFLYQLNLLSVAPVGILDVARVWPASVGTRYAAGGGVRLSLVNANFTLGYAFNVQKRPGEGPGALFLSLDVTDLFR
jgi:hypothetical protein